jgi:sugar transferase (PEP-CTERM/EpsH1 system associated)
MMKLLMLTHRFPYPPVRGDCIRAWGELEYLARRHDVWLACVDRARPWPAQLAEAERRCRGVAVCVRSPAACLLRGGLSVLRGRSLTEGYFADRRLVRVLQSWAERISFDAVLTFSSAMAPYAGLIGAIRRVLDMNDLDSFKWRSYAGQAPPPLSWPYRLEARRLAAAESAWVRAQDVTLLVNERERRKLGDWVEPSRLAVVRTGVDVSRYRQVGVGPEGISVPAEPVVGTLGSMCYAPNVRAVNWFGRRVWPVVKRSRPQARWLVVGNRPRRTVRRWHQPPDVTVTGFVADVRPYLRRMRVFAVPVVGDIGVQTKLIEAMAAGKAAVVTPDAAAGIDYSDQPPFLMAQTPEQYAQCVLRLLSDDQLAAELGARARAVVEANYRVEQQVRSIERWLQPEAAADQPVAYPRPMAGAQSGEARSVRSCEVVNA